MESNITEAMTKTDNWNIAQGYSNFKILMPLIKCDSLIDNIEFGSESIDLYMEMNNNYGQSYIIQRRQQALFRLRTEILKIIRSSIKLIRKSDISEMIEIRNKIIKNKLAFDNAIIETNNEVIKKKEYSINILFFNTAFNCLIDSLEEVTGLLHKNHLIFPGKDEMDFEEFKKSFIESGGVV